MTDTELNVETLAQRIAARGHDALVERLRVAYSDAAAAHADIVSLDDARIETLVQSAADRADGLQWRRALAGVAAEELDLSVPEALSHPAVARAQALVGAPSYEQSLAELIARPVPPASGNGAVPRARPLARPPRTWWRRPMASSSSTPNRVRSSRRHGRQAGDRQARGGRGGRRGFRAAARARSGRARDRALCGAA